MHVIDSKHGSLHVLKDTHIPKIDRTEAFRVVSLIKQAHLTAQELSQLFECLCLQLPKQVCHHLEPRIKRRLALSFPLVEDLLEVAARLV